MAVEFKALLEKFQRRLYNDATADLGEGWPRKQYSRDQTDDLLEGMLGKTDWSDTLAKCYVGRLNDAYREGNIYSVEVAVANRQIAGVGRRLETPCREELKDSAGIPTSMFDELWGLRYNGKNALPVRSAMGGTFTWSNSLGQAWYQFLIELSAEFGAVIIAPRYGIGGGEKVVLQLAAAQHANTGKKSLILVLDSDDAIEEDLDTYAKVVCLANKSVSGMMFEQYDLDTKIELLKRCLGVLDFSCLFIINSSIATSALARGDLVSDRYKICYALFSVPRSAKNAVLGFVLNVPWIYKYVDCFITDNHAMKDHLEETSLLGHKVSVLNIPTDLLPYKPTLGRSNTVLWASRLDTEKRLDLLIDIAESMPDTRFRVYGTPVFAGSEIVDMLNAVPNIDYRGAFNGFSSLDRSECYAFLYTSLFDGMPNIVLEAMSAGMPVVATAVGGVPNALSNGRGISLSLEADATEYVPYLGSLRSGYVDRLIMGYSARKYIRHQHNEKQFQTALKRVTRFHDAG